ncbi:uncharacterized protein LOC144744309 [Ciona intestinalis]
MFYTELFACCLKVNSGADKEKRRVSKHLKTVGFSSIKNSTCRFIVLFPSIHDHSGHPVGEAAGIQQRVDSRVIDKVGELIDDRVCSIMEIQRHLKVFVVKELFKNATPPLQSNRRFFPTKKDISNHYYNAYTKRKLSKIDQANVQLLVDEWSCKSPKDNIVFRPYIASGCPKPLHEEIGNDDITALHSKQTLLFIYQTAWQKRLLLRYGQDICLIFV